MTCLFFRLLAPVQGRGLTTVSADELTEAPSTSLFRFEAVYAALPSGAAPVHLLPGVAVRLVSVGADSAVLTALVPEEPYVNPQGRWQVWQTRVRWCGLLAPRSAFVRLFHPPPRTVCLRC